MLLLLPDGDGGALGGAPAAPPSPAPAAAESDAGEGTTPEEVATVLKNSGINLPPEPTITPANEDEEEGDDPDELNNDDPVETDEERETREAEEAVQAQAEKDQAAAEAKAEADRKATEAPTDATDDKYSFQVKDANGTTYKITADAKMEDILADFEPTNNGQIIDILNQLRQVQDQKQADEKAATEEAAEAENAKQVAEIQKGWEHESKDLQAQKRIPTGDDGDKRIAEVYDYMSKENGRRMEAGKPMLQSFEDALDKLEMKESRDAEAAKAKAAKDDARKKGSLVGGASAPASSPPPVYRANSARNSQEALKSMGLI